MEDDVCINKDANDIENVNKILMVSDRFLFLRLVAQFTFIKDIKVNEKISLTSYTKYASNSWFYSFKRYINDESRTQTLHDLKVLNNESRILIRTLNLESLKQIKELLFDVHIGLKNLSDTYINDSEYHNHFKLICTNFKKLEISIDYWINFHDLRSTGILPNQLGSNNIKVKSSLSDISRLDQKAQSVPYRTGNSILFPTFQPTLSNSSIKNVNRVSSSVPITLPISEPINIIYPSKNKLFNPVKEPLKKEFSDNFPLQIGVASFIRDVPPIVPKVPIVDNSITNSTILNNQHLDTGNSFEPEVKVEVDKPKMVDRFFFQSESFDISADIVLSSDIEGQNINHDSNYEFISDFTPDSTANRDICSSSSNLDNDTYSMTSDNDDIKEVKSVKDVKLRRNSIEILSSEEILNYSTDGSEPLYPSYINDYLSQYSSESEAEAESEAESESDSESDSERDGENENENMCYSSRIVMPCNSITNDDSDSDSGDEEIYVQLKSPSSLLPMTLQKTLDTHEKKSLKTNKFKNQ